MLHELYLFLLVVSTVRICLSPFDNQTKYFAVKLQLTFEHYVVQSSYSPPHHSPCVGMSVCGYSKGKFFPNFSHPGTIIKILQYHRRPIGELKLYH